MQRNFVTISKVRKRGLWSSINDVTAVWRGANDCVTTVFKSTLKYEKICVESQNIWKYFLTSFTKEGRRNFYLKSCFRGWGCPNFIYNISFSSRVLQIKRISFFFFYQFFRNNLHHCAFCNSRQSYKKLALYI